MFQQGDHPLRIDSPLGKDVLLIDRMEGQEGISTLFEFHLQLRSSNLSIDPTSLIGQSVTVSIDRTDNSGAERYFNGIVTRFESHGNVDLDTCLYSAVLRPWLWLLSQTADCRIFQQKSALDIAKTVLAEAGSFPLDVRVNSQPPPRDYCVQYNETDFEFVSRLLEDEGIYYYFRHEKGKHVLVLGDDSSACVNAAESSVSFKQNLSAGSGKDRIRAWSHGYELRPGKFAHTDYNFETPTSNLLAQSSAGKLPGMSKSEIFEYPGSYGVSDAGQRRATVRADQGIFEYDAVNGQSIVEAFAPGNQFSVTAHHTAAETGRRYLLTRVWHQANQQGAYDPAVSQQPPLYTNRFVAISADAKIRPARKTPKPRIVGPQPAQVVGPAGEEIWTDKYGRVKVQFYWDRYGKKDDNSSCWVRVAFYAAGATWGMVAIPRIGYEVVVEFVDGDPDRPLITGCVYNARNMPPVSGGGAKSGTPSDMPGAKMMTTFRSQSLKKTGGFNEITMNDTSGSETFFLKAQYDEIHKVGHDRDDYVKNDRTTLIDHDDKHTVTNDRTTKINHDDNLTVANNRTDKINNNREITIANGDKLKVGAAREITIGSNDKLTVSANRDVNVTGNATESAMQISLTGQVKITLSCGGSTIEMTPAMISIQAPIVKIN